MVLELQSRNQGDISVCGAPVPMGGGMSFRDSQGDSYREASCFRSVIATVVAVVALSFLLRGA